jgi:hypothetical protein
VKLTERLLRLLRVADLSLWRSALVVVASGS